MATISGTSRPGYVWDSTDNVWYPIGTGVHTHDYIPSTLPDAKGDLITATANDTPARLAVGNNGETLVADSSTSTGLRYQGSVEAGKNIVINGGFDIWQRGTSSASQGYVTADRWYMTGASTTFSQETSDVPTGFRYALKCTMSGTAQPQPILTIETQDSIKFAGKTVVLSYYVKTSNSTPAVMRIDSSNNVDESVTGTYSTIATYSVATTTSWQRVALSFDIPSTSKTLRVVVGASGNLTSGQTILLTGVQVELGSVATTFSRAGGTIQGELAACQRYYVRWGGDQTYQYLATGMAGGTTTMDTVIPLPVFMRVPPTSVDYSTLACYDTSGVYAGTNFTIQGAAKQTVQTRLTVASGLIQYRPYFLITNNSSAAYLGFSAEL